VSLWDVNTGQCLQTLQGHNNEVWSVAFNPDGDTLVSCSDDNIIYGVSALNVSERSRTPGWVCSVAFSKDGQTLVSGSDDHTIGL